MNMLDQIEIVIEDDEAFFSWNDETIQAMAEELGTPEFAESRPCG